MDERFTFKAEKDLIENLKKAARSMGMTASTLARIAIIEKLAREGVK